MCSTAYIELMFISSVFLVQSNTYSVSVALFSVHMGKRKCYIVSRSLIKKVTTCLASGKKITSIFQVRYRVKGTFK